MPEVSTLSDHALYKFRFYFNSQFLCKKQYRQLICYIYILHTHIILYDAFRLNSVDFPTQIRKHEVLSTLTEKDAAISEPRFDPGKNSQCAEFRLGSCNSSSTTIHLDSHRQGRNITDPRDK